MIMVLSFNSSEGQPVASTNHLDMCVSQLECLVSQAISGKTLCLPFPCIGKNLEPISIFAF
ncbi:hypothetical protein LEMLEM_LOCUS23131, partial [Lemmus lemmus]